MKIRSLKDIDFSHKRVILRSDLDVPLTVDRHVVVSDDFRLVRARETIDLLLSKSAKIIIIGHLGRPGGRVVEEYRLAPIQDWFNRAYSNVKYTRSTVGMDARQAVLSLNDREILLLENLRFDSGEEANREGFASELSTYGQIYVNDCFSASHRNHASVAGIPKFLPSYAGLSLEKEITTLSQVITHPRKPLLVIIGGSKLETKVPVIDKFLGIADKILVTGKVGAQMDKLPHYRSPKLIYSVGDPDILPDELERFSSIISIAGTIIWNGPAGDIGRGYWEGTRSLARLISETSAQTIVGGGDTNEALKKFGLREKFSFVSSGGGAMLDFLSGKELPGLKPLIVV